MNNLEAGLFFTSQTVSITYEYSWEHIQSEKLCFPFESVFVQAVFPDSLLSMRTKFSVCVYSDIMSTKKKMKRPAALFGEIIDYWIKAQFLFLRAVNISEFVFRPNDTL